MNEIDVKLIDDYMNGEAVNMDALEHLLRTAPEARQFLRELAMVDTILQLEAEHAAQVTPVMPTMLNTKSEFNEIHRDFRWRARFILLAISCLSILFVILYHSGGEIEQVAISTGPTIATVVSVNDARVNRDQSRFFVGQRLPACRIQLTSGSVTIQFDNGSLITLRGLTVFQLLSMQSGTLESGELLFENRQSSESFSLATKYSKLLDIGTTYSVSIDGENEKVCVIQGEVWVESIQDVFESYLVPAGKAHNLGNGIASIETMSPDEAPSWEHDQPQPLENKPYLSVENFTYPDGVYEPKVELNSGSGWNSPWKWFSRDLTERLLDRSLIQVEGGRVIASNNTLLQRALGRSIDTSSDETNFFCFEFEFLTDCSNDVFFFRLFDAQGAQKNNNINYELLLVGHQQKIISKLGRTQSQLAYSFQRNTPYRVIGKIVTRSRGIDEVYVNVEPSDQPIPLKEPKEWLLISRPVDLNLPFDRIALHTYSNGRQAINSLVLSNNWEQLINSF
jgi:hypothetical protein